MRVPRSLAALATVPGRETALAECLKSLRPQVEAIRVVCHDMDEPPAIVRQLADDWTCEPDVAGSAAKIRWCREWEGLYLACDDDWRYPVNYAQQMLRWVQRWQGKALVACFGKVLNPTASRFQDASFGCSPQSGQNGRWLNYPGFCAAAWDTRLPMPTHVPGKNLEESYYAIHCQRHRIPIWLAPHGEHWLTWLLPELAPGVPTIWESEKAAKFVNRNGPIGEYAAAGGRWQVFRVGRGGAVESFAA